MSTRLLVVTAKPTGAARWHVDIPAHIPVTTRTLASARALVERRVAEEFDLQVALGGLEDLCADAVDLGQRSDASTIDALRLRRRVALALTAVGIRKTDVAYLTGIASGSVAHLLSVPIESPWMSAGHAPPTPFPQQRVDVTWTAGTRRITAVVATRDGSGWHVHLNGGSRPTRRTSLVHAEKLVRDMAGDTDVVLCPQLPDELDDMLRTSDFASAAAQDLQVQAYELRRHVAGRLRALRIGFADVGELLAIHPHRVRLLLGR